MNDSGTTSLETRDPYSSRDHLVRMAVLVVALLAVLAGTVSVIYLTSKIERTRLAYDISIQLQLHRRLALVKASYDLETTFLSQEATPVGGDWQEPAPEQVITITGR